MRNIFDQFEQPENRVTHALMTALDLDRGLLAAFLHELVKVKPPRGVKQLGLLEQRYPGQPEQREEEDEKRGVPDGWIFDEKRRWCVFIETKVLIKLTAAQIERHRRTALRRGYILAKPIVILPRSALSLPSDVTVIEWRDVYAWLLKKRAKSQWARHLANYLEVIERKLIDTKQFREDTLTKFAGFPFSADEPYTYLEGKRLLNLAMDELRQRRSLQRKLGVNRKHKGRGAITGKRGDAVWDFLSLSKTSDKKLFTHDPHLTLGITSRAVEVTLTLPNGLNRSMRNAVKTLDLDGFLELLAAVLKRLRPMLRKHKGAVPIFRGVQRRYLSQRAQPFVDARIDFDLRTAVASKDRPKLQPVWAKAAYDAFVRKRGTNYQVQVGVVFPYERCPEVARDDALDLVEQSWLACAPVVSLVK